MQAEANIKNILQREFIRRCKKNRGYSLRAYARYLEIDQSTCGTSKLYWSDGKFAVKISRFDFIERINAHVLWAPKVNVSSL